MDERVIYRCECGCWKFYQGYSTIRCAMCGEVQPGKLFEQYYPAHPDIIMNHNFVSKETETEVTNVD